MVKWNYIFHMMDYATKISERAVVSVGRESNKKAASN